VSTQPYIINKYHCLLLELVTLPLRTRDMLSATLFTRPNSTFLAVHFVRAYSVPAGQQVPKKKVWDSVHAAVGVVKSGDVLLSGGMPSGFVSTVRC